MSGRSETGHRAQHVTIDLPRVGLSGDGVGVRETKEFGHSLVKSLHLGVVSVKESKEGGLGSGRSLDSSETEVGSSSSQVSEIPKEFLDRV